MQQMDFGKSVILSAIPLVAAIPLYRWVKDNDDDRQAKGFFK
ncbi:hypothetical protein [Lacimicrobium alkaliphilum]|uniref:Glutamyl-tRNA amidotransferase n=1 Tax=Lacimicrobium alkaliphilum TaxID=1526571 RepID=A0ABQ1RR29_9ALTE|nr:hypothetical protein [Lacimicrobium alkaliphilum]GGD78247.1 hypothetical protein GCM10011357_36650 [Lacimicrobium alkaliphilum]